MLRLRSFHDNEITSIARRATPTLRDSASWTLSITPCQSPISVCLKSVAVGYQGLSSRPSIQRQSGENGNRIHTGLPRAPARCATDVSTEITRSRHAITAAVSVKSASRGRRSRIREVSERKASSSGRHSFCKR